MRLISIAIQYISESTMAAANSVEVGTAQYDFTGSAPDELSFVKGDKIQVTEVISDEWLRGKLDGREGMFPRTFVELSQQTGMVETSTEIDIKEPKQATCLSHGRKPEVNISHTRIVVSPRFSN